MNRDLLLHLPVVAGVARHRGFAAAGAALGMSASAVSHAVRAVEDRLGEPLFARTTRSVSLTEAGARFLASVGPALDDIDKAFEGLAAARGEATGLLKISASRIAIAMALTPILAKIAWTHPNLTVEVHANEAFVDIVAQGFDAGVRLGEAVQQDMTIVRLTPPFKAMLVAAPRYLEARGEPTSLSDLTQHNCIGFRMPASGGLYEWDLRDGEKDVAVATRGTAIVTDSLTARDLAVAGVGVAYVFAPVVRADVETGRLRALLPDNAIEEDGLFLYFPRRAALAPKLRAFIDVARSCASQV